MNNQSYKYNVDVEIRGPRNTLVRSCQRKIAGAVRKAVNALMRTAPVKKDNVLFISTTRGGGGSQLDKFLNDLEQVRRKYPMCYIGGVDAG